MGISWARHGAAQDTNEEHFQWACDGPQHTYDVILPLVIVGHGKNAILLKEFKHQKTIQLLV